MSDEISTPVDGTCRVRMENDRIPKRVFYGQLPEAPRHPGGQKLRLKDTLRKQLNEIGVTQDSWEELALDRTTWRKTIIEGSQKFEERRIAKMVAKHDQRHRILTGAINSAYICPQCNRDCLSRIGLSAHTRAHQRRTEQQTATEEPVNRRQAAAAVAQYQCSICGKICKSGAALKSHSRAHTRSGN
jgi:hypothetical protein